MRSRNRQKGGEALHQRKKEGGQATPTESSPLNCVKKSRRCGGGGGGGVSMNPVPGPNLSASNKFRLRERGQFPQAQGDERKRLEGLILPIAIQGK